MAIEIKNHDGEVILVVNADTLVGANLSSAYLRPIAGFSLENADFSNMDLTGVNFEYTDLNGASFYNANLSEANFRGADLTGAYFGKANLSKTTLRNAELRDVNFYEANLFRTTF